MDFGFLNCMSLAVTVSIVRICIGHEYVRSVRYVRSQRPDQYNAYIYRILSSPV